MGSGARAAQGNWPRRPGCPHLRLFTHELGLDQATREAILGKTARALWYVRRPDP
jgi:hypothetical protein